MPHIGTMDQLEYAILEGGLSREDIMCDDELYALWASDRVRVESALEEYRERFYDRARLAAPEKVSVYIKSDGEDDERFRALELLREIGCAVTMQAEEAGTAWHEHFASSWRDLEFPAYFGQEVLLIDGAVVKTTAARAAALVQPSSIYPSRVVAMADTCEASVRLGAVQGHMSAEDLTLIFDIVDGTTRVEVHRPIRLKNGKVRVVEDRTCELEEVPNLVTAELSF